MLQRPYVRSSPPLPPAKVASTDEDTKSSTTQESTVFNKPEDSDIIIEYHGNKVHAHRAILRMCSPFFERILQSQWPVAKGPVFSLGNDDDPVVVDAMLRHMYNLSYSQALKYGSFRNAYKFHLDVFMLADKYDCPSLRRAAVSKFRLAANSSLDKSRPYDLSTDASSLIEIIPYLCGPEAIQSTDSSLHNEVLNFCAINYTKMFENAPFRVHLKDGSMFDEDSMIKLLRKIGAVALKKQAEANSNPPGSRWQYGLGGPGGCVRIRYPYDDDDDMKVE